jgi:protease PrsW
LKAVAVFLVSAAPAAAFLLYILWMDRREPEPIRFVLRSFFLGALGCFPAMIVEVVLDYLPIFHIGGFAGSVLVSFLQVAPVEEACKLLVVVLFLWNHPDFNEENDGIVYTGTAALGFAFLENLFYVAQEGLGIGILRAFSSVPLHVSTGIILGYHAGKSRFLVDPKEGKRTLWKGLAIAWLVHGIYDSLALSQSVAVLLLIPLVLAVSSLAVIYANRGRRLSLARWGNGQRPPQAAAAASEAAAEPAFQVPAAPVNLRPKRRYAKPSRIPIVISRTLFVLVLVFWALLLIGLIKPESEGDEWTAVLGGVVLSFLPVLLGAFLEIAHERRRKRVYRESTLR